MKWLTLASLTGLVGGALPLGMRLSLGTTDCNDAQMLWIPKRSVSHTDLAD